jgi:hypothetical protein
MTDTMSGAHQARAIVPLLMLHVTIVVVLLALLAQHVLLTGDMVLHFILVDEIMKHGGVQPGSHLNGLVMPTYPQVSHWLAAIVGWSTGSGFVGIIVVSILSIYVSYLMIIRLVGAALPVNLLLFTSAFALLARTHSLIGWEVVVNWFYPQLVADVIYFASLLWLSKKAPIWQQALFVPLAGAATMWVQPLVAVHIFGAGATLIAFLVTEEWHRESTFPTRTALYLLLLVTLCAFVSVLHPSLQVMRTVAMNNGYLEFGYSRILLVAMVCAGIGIINLWRHFTDRAEYVDAVLGSALVAATLLAVAQFAALQMLSEGSDYAVKKHMFIVVTLGAMNAVRIIAWLTGPFARREAIGKYATPIMAAFATIYILKGFKTPVAPILEALAYANDVAKSDVPGFRPGNTVADDISIPPLANYMISLTALQHPPTTSLMENPKQDAKLVMIRRTPDTDQICEQRLYQSKTHAIVDPACLKIYPLNKTLRFGEGGNGWRYATEGWMAAGSSNVWSLGIPGGTIQLSLAQNLDVPYEINVTGMALLNQKHPEQEVRVEVNGIDIAAWTYHLAAPIGERSAIIPAQMASSGSLRIDFKAINPVSPAQMGMNTDPRIFGFGLESLTVRPCCMAVNK